jgi:hypothetical protein
MRVRKNVCCSRIEVPQCKIGSSRPTGIILVKARINPTRIIVVLPVFVITPDCCSSVRPGCDLPVCPSITIQSECWINKVGIVPRAATRKRLDAPEVRRVVCVWRVSRPNRRIHTGYGRAWSWWDWCGGWAWHIVLPIIGIGVKDLHYKFIVHKIRWHVNAVEITIWLVLVPRIRREWTHSSVIQRRIWVAALPPATRAPYLQRQLINHALSAVRLDWKQPIAASRRDRGHAGGGRVYLLLCRGRGARLGTENSYTGHAEHNQCKYNMQTGTTARNCAGSGELKMLLH